MSRERSEFAVGFMVLAAFAVFFYSTLRVGACSFMESSGTRITAHFDDASGVGPRTEVSVAGVRVGEVESVELEAGRARLVLRIEDEDLSLPIDSEVTIRSRGMLGERLVAIEPGASDRFAVEGDTLLHTREAPNLDALLDSLASVSEDISQVTRSLRLVMGGAEGEEAVAAVVEDIRSVARQMRDFVDENQGSFTRVVGNLDAVSGNLESFTSQLVSLGDEDQSLEELFDTFRSASLRMEEAVGHLASVSERLESGEGTLGKLLRDDVLYTKLDTSVTELQRTLTEVRRAAEEAQEQLPVTVLGSVVGSLF